MSKKLDEAAAEALHTKAVLTKVTITIFTARVKDARAGREIERVMGAEVGVGNYTKSLVSKQLTNRMNATVKAARREYENLTLPWGSDGTRLLPTEQWLPFNDAIAQRQKEFWDTVEEFLRGYEEHRQNKRRLGQLYSDKDYAPVETIRKKFSFDVTYAPVPESGDLRVDLANGQLAKLKAAVDESVKEELAVALRSVFYRIHDAVRKFHDQITNDQDWVGVRPKTFEHMQAMAKLLPSLNVANDPKLAEVIATLNEGIVAFDASDLRNLQGKAINPAAKRQATQAAKRILTRLKKEGIDDA
jgi:hypothetical protein